MPTTKITRGSNFARAVKYDLEQGVNKEDQAKIKRLPATEDEAVIKGYVQGQRARLLATNVSGETPKELAAEFKRVAAQKPGIKEPVHKVSISLKPGEHLTTHQWLEVGKSYLDEMGFADAPFLIAQHREKDHEHIHIVASRVDYNGKVVSDVFEKNRARTWARAIEEKYDLSSTPDRAEEKGLSRVEIEQAERTQKTPPKLILQQSIRQTLAAHPETPDFIAALERQNISIQVRTKEKEIFGVSFGINGRGFKGGSLGTKFTWQGLQKEGLKYEFERDYERLEAACRSRSQAESEPAGSKLSDGQFKRETFSDGRTDVRRKRINRSTEFSTADDRTINYADAERITEVARLGGSKQSAAQPVSITATEAERIAEERDGSAESGDGAIENGYQGELRRTRRFDSGETETARRVEPENGEASAAGETDEATASFARQQQIEQHERAEAEYFRRQEAERWLALFDQLSISSDFQSIGNGLLPAASAPNSVEIPGAGTIGIESAALDGLAGRNLADSADDSVADFSNPQGHLGVFQAGALPNDDYAGSDLSSFRLDGNSNSGNSFLPGNNTSDGGADDEPVQHRSVDLSASLRSSLEYAETMVKKTLATEDTLKVEEVKKLKIEKQEQIEFEEVISRGLSM